MRRFVLRSPQTEQATRAFSRIEAEPRVRVIDRVGDKLALIELPEEDVPRLKSLLSDWFVEPERDIELSETGPEDRSSAADFSR